MHPEHYFGLLKDVTQYQVVQYFLLKEQEKLAKQSNVEKKTKVEAKKESVSKKAKTPAKKKTVSKKVSKK